MNRACEEQLRLIAQHRLRLSTELGEDVSPEVAARDWITKYAALWREWWESNPECDSNPFSFRLPAVTKLAAG